MYNILTAPGGKCQLLECYYAIVELHTKQISGLHETPWGVDDAPPTVISVVLEDGRRITGFKIKGKWLLEPLYQALPRPPATSPPLAPQQPSSYDLGTGAEW